MTKSRVFLLTILVLCFQLFINVGESFAQEDCATKIQEARKLYDQGMIDEIPKMLAPCMEEGFTRVQKVEAYKLIILSYLFDDNQFEAEKTMLEFLKKYPEYEVSPNDPIEFVYLFESYRTTSVFSFGITAGFNLTDPRIIEPVSTFDLSQAELKNTMKPGFQVGLGIGRYIRKNMVFNIEFNFTSNQYKFTDEIRQPLIDGLSSVSYTEKLFKVEMPVYVAYEFNIQKVNCYVSLGASAAKITGTTGQSSRKFHENMQSLSGESTDVSAYRTSMLYSGLAGAGIRYKVPRGVIAVGLRAGFGINNIVASYNKEFVDKFYYSDDDFSLNTYSLTAGYYFSFYKPKKQR
ncbi:MAG: PorT family protein [Bacteroidales bacterium]|nr:PorT family protein [Bacteroidales bacterium]